MRYDPAKHRRRSIRLRGYDYSQAGAHFVTVCAQGRACLFGEVVDGEMRLKEAGRMIERWWAELNTKFPTLATDEYAVMPNHFRGIVVIGCDRGDHDDDVGADLRVCPETKVAGGASRGAHAGAPLPGIGAQGGLPGAIVGADLCVCPETEDSRGTSQGAHAGAPLPEIVQWFKTMTTNDYIRGVNAAGWPPFAGRLWQRNYHEHIIRTEEALERIRAYILANPARWSFDRENPAAVRPEPKDAWLS